MARDGRVGRFWIQTDCEYIFRCRIYTPSTWIIKASLLPKGLRPACYLKPAYYMLD
jgi:hypothetical protein